jgi:small subunit ribosomal protein S21
MLRIPVKKGENIEKVLKKYKRKFQKTQVMKELRSRKEFKKPSVKRRQAVIKAKYIQGIRTDEKKISEG